MIKSLKSQLRQFSKTVWFFPVVLLIFILILSLFKISGSSIGVYNQILYGNNHVDQNLLTGHPELIRSDEWLVTTQLTIAQSKNHFRSFNPNIGSGENVSVILDQPYLDWSTLFKPQNWSFFVLPLEQAFAFKWWFIGWLLITGCYFFVLAVLPGRRLLAALLGLAIFFSPFIQWWYETITLASLGYALLIAAVLVSLVKARTRSLKTWLTIGLVYLLTSFALILYPPFQIPCIMAVAVFFAGYVLEQLPKEHRLAYLKNLWPIGLAGVSAGLILAGFLLTRLDVIKAITGTVYPGHRTAPSGGFRPDIYLSSFLARNLESPFRSAHFWTNQSEASDFFQLWPFLFVPSLVMIYKSFREQSKQLWGLLLVDVLLLVFAARLFLPLPEKLAHLLLLDTIPHTRLLIGFGLLGLAQLILLIKSLTEQPLPKPLAGLTALATLIISVVAGTLVRHSFPIFVLRRREIWLPALALTVIIYAYLKNYARFGTVLLLGLSFYTTRLVNPLYVGLKPLTGSNLATAIKVEQAKQPGGWVELDNMYFINFALTNGLKSYSLSYPYPDLPQWYQLDPSHSQSDTYNRYAYAVFTSKPLPSAFQLVQNDVFYVRYNPCSPEFKGIKHVLTTVPLNSVCASLSQTVSYPAVSFYIYSVQ